MSEKVVCETPTPGKKPTRIDRWKYDLIREAILDIVPAGGDGFLFKELPQAVRERLIPDDLDRLGSVTWYTTSVKLDMEVKGELKRVKRASPQRLLKSR